MWFEILREIWLRKKVYDTRFTICAIVANEH